MKYEDFISSAANQVGRHSIYLWGGQGELVNQLTSKDIDRYETDSENAKRVKQFIEMENSFGWINKYTRAFDCSGLVCWLLIKVGREKEGFDTTANNLGKRYPQTRKLLPGVLVYRSGHVGIYVGNGHIIEAKGRDYGVVVSPFVASQWNSTYADPFTDER